MKKKLEEIFWDGDRFRKANGVWVGVIPICEPISIKMGNIYPEEDYKKIKNRVDTDFTYKNLEIDAYCKGIPSMNEHGNPIQLYKIKSN
jgi:3-deoxy-D-arabino-heptulosonate 7-phosphate (DAHP) synthase class II